MDNPTSEDLLRFYQGHSADSKGRMIEDIWSWDYQRLEYTHDYIQWLFPLKERSQFNWKAPVLNDDIIQVFRTNDNLKKRLLQSFKVMLRFYGLQCKDIGNQTIEINKSDEYQERKLNWIDKKNHNYLRITRILTTLMLLGLEKYAKAFFQCLDKIYLEEDEIIGSVTYAYWEKAVSSV